MELSRWIEDGYCAPERPCQRCGATARVPMYKKGRKIVIQYCRNCISQYTRSDGDAA